MVETGSYPTSNRVFSGDVDSVNRFSDLSFDSHGVVFFVSDVLVGKFNGSNRGSGDGVPFG